MSRRRFPVLEISVFDHLAVKVDGREVELASKKMRAVLGYLAMTEGKREVRARLAALLWSDSLETRSRGSLRQCIHGLRDTLTDLGFDAFRADKQSVWLDPTRVTIDHEIICKDLERGEVHARLLEGEELCARLLRDVQDADPLFSTWLETRRRSLNRQLMGQLERLMRSSAVHSAARDEAAQAILVLEPVQEEAVRCLMQSHADRGDFAGALLVYKTLWDRLEDEIEVEPSQETKALAAAIRMAQPEGDNDPGARPESVPASKSLRSAVAPLAAADTVERSISLAARAAGPLKVAVEAFDATGVSADRRYLVLGFRRELMGRLSRFREWRIRDLATGAPVNGCQEAAPAAYRVEASALETAGGIGLSLNVSETATGEVVWGGPFEISLERWNESQRSIVRSLASEFNFHVALRRTMAAEPQPASDLTAFDLWLRGQAKIMSFKPEDWQAGLDLFREAISRMPTFAPAYSSLAQLYNTIHYAKPGTLRSRARNQEALRYAREALRLDPADSRSHLCLGWANSMAGLHDIGHNHHRLAADLNESDPWTLISSALGFAFGGDRDGARKLADEARSLTPNPAAIHWRYQAIMHFLDEDYENCAVAADLADRAVPNALGWRVAALSRLGRRKAAAQEWTTFCELVAARWLGAGPPTERAVAGWFLRAFPLRRRADWERLREGLAAAGAPVDGLVFGAWYEG